MTATDEEKLQVLDYVKASIRRHENEYGVLSFYAVGAKDIIKFIERPEACERWPYDFECRVEEAIASLAKKYIVPFPEIEEQTEEDRVLSKLFKKHKNLTVGNTDFFNNYFQAHHFIYYMERHPDIYKWDAYFIKKLQHEIKRMKEILF